MKRWVSGVVMVILIIIASGCLQQSTPQTTEQTLTLLEGNYNTIYLNEKAKDTCPPGKVPVTFTYNPQGENVTSVSLRGTFNDWGEWPMKKEEGVWTFTFFF